MHETTDHVSLEADDVKKVKSLHDKWENSHGQLADFLAMTSSFDVGRWFAVWKALLQSRGFWLTAVVLSAMMGLQE